MADDVDDDDDDEEDGGALSAALGAAQTDGNLAKRLKVKVKDHNYQGKT